MSEAITNEDLKLIGPDEFKSRFAENVGIAAVRDLFKSEGFPAVKIGTRYYTTARAAKQFLETLGT